MQKLKLAVERFKKELKIYQLVLKDSRTPVMAKWLLGAAIGYLALPFDLIPDFIPILGQLDDLVIVPLLVFLAVRMIPKDVVDDCRQRVNNNSNSVG